MISILIPSIPQRIDRLKELIAKYESYISLYNLDAEIISLIDNKRMTIGAKRNALVDLARGSYWVMSDEDDELTEVYFSQINKINEVYYEGSSIDVVTYLQSARINEDQSTVKFGLKNINEELVKDGITNRPAWHCCTWRKEAVKDARFDSSLNWGEDDLFQRVANQLAKTEIHIPEICHIYAHDSHLTAAFQ